MPPRDKVSGPSLSTCRLTAPLRSAVATVAVSGDGASQAVGQLFRPATPRAEISVGRVAFGHWSTGEELVVCRVATNRFEIHCHGGHSAAAAILESLAAVGAVELDWAAWTNAHTADSLEASAWRALQGALTERTAAIALDQCRGALGREWRNVLRLLEEGRLAEAERRLRVLAESGVIGRRLAAPFKVVLAGPPNAGKSTLLNALAGYQRSLVHAAPGTTRDVVSAMTAMDGWPVELCDTAGLREASDPLEADGIQLGRRQLQDCDATLLLVDATDAESPRWLAATQWPGACIRVWNKCDQLTQQQRRRWAAAEKAPGIWLSALGGEGLPELTRAMVRALVGDDPPPPGAAAPLTESQCEAIELALGALEKREPATALQFLKREL